MLEEKLNSWFFKCFFFGLWAKRFRIPGRKQLARFSNIRSRCSDILFEIFGFEHFKENSIFQNKLGKFVRTPIKFSRNIAKTFPHCYEKGTFGFQREVSREIIKFWKKIQLNFIGFWTNFSVLFCKELDFIVITALYVSWRSFLWTFSFETNSASVFAALGHKLSDLWWKPINPSALFSELHFQSAHEILEEDFKTWLFSNFNFGLSKTISDFRQKKLRPDSQNFFFTFPEEFRGWMFFLKKTS